METSNKMDLAARMNSALKLTEHVLLELRDAGKILTFSNPRFEEGVIPLIVTAPSEVYYDHEKVLDIINTLTMAVDMKTGLFTEPHIISETELCELEP